MYLTQDMYACMYDVYACMKCAYVCMYVMLCIHVMYVCRLRMLRYVRVCMYAVYVYMSCIYVGYVPNVFYVVHECEVMGVCHDECVL